MPLSQSQSQGALIGTFVGDALGMPVEGWSYRRIRDQHGTIDRMLEGRLGPGTYTDDTQMMIALARSLLRCKGVDEEDLAKAFLDHFDPRRGYGRGTRSVFQRWCDGESVEQASSQIFDGGSFGNGGAMRIAPVGVLHSGYPEELERAVRRSVRITHAHPLGIGGALLQARAVCLAAARDPGSVPGKPGRFVERVFQGLPDDFNPEGFWDSKVESVQELLDDPGPADPSDVVDRLGTNSTTGGSVLTAQYAVCSHMDSFEQSMSYAVSLGGDTDTIGAMAGAIAGALHGVDAVPDRWFGTLENEQDGRDQVLDLGERLWELHRKLHGRSND